jgi:uncharacterized protein YndB with AHSA1/START domain
MAKQLVVKKSIKIHAPAARIWNIIASPDSWEKWMLVVPEVEQGKRLRVGNKVFWKNEDGNPYLTGTVTALEPKKQFVLELEDISWKRRAKPGEVTYALTLSEKADVTHVEFSLGDLAIDPEARQWYDAYNESHELEDIKRMAEKTPV